MLLSKRFSVHVPLSTDLSGLTEEAVKEDAHTQEDDGVGVYYVPPQRLLRRVCELLLHLGFLLFGELRCFFLLKATEPVVAFPPAARF